MDILSRRGPSTTPGVLSIAYHRASSSVWVLCSWATLALGIHVSFDLTPPYRVWFGPLCRHFPPRTVVPTSRRYFNFWSFLDFNIPVKFHFTDVAACAAVSSRALAYTLQLKSICYGVSWARNAPSPLSSSLIFLTAGLKSPCNNLLLITSKHIKTEAGHSSQGSSLFPLVLGKCWWSVNLVIRWSCEFLANGNRLKRKKIVLK